MAQQKYVPNLIGALGAIGNIQQTFNTENVSNINAQITKGAVDLSTGDLSLEDQAKGMNNLQLKFNEVKEAHNPVVQKAIQANFDNVTLGLKKKINKGKQDLFIEALANESYKDVSLGAATGNKFATNRAVEVRDLITGEMELVDAKEYGKSIGLDNNKILDTISTSIVNGIINEKTNAILSAGTSEDVLEVNTDVKFSFEGDGAQYMNSNRITASAKAKAKEVLLKAKSQRATALLTNEMYQAEIDNKLNDKMKVYKSLKKAMDNGLTIPGTTSNVIINSTRTHAIREYRENPSVANMNTLIKDLGISKHKFLRVEAETAVDLVTQHNIDTLITDVDGRQKDLVTLIVGNKDAERALSVPLSVEYADNLKRNLRDGIEPRPDHIEEYNKRVVLAMQMEEQGIVNKWTAAYTSLGLFEQGKFSTPIKTGKEFKIEQATANAVVDELFKDGRPVGELRRTLEVDGEEVEATSDLQALRLWTKEQAKTWKGDEQSFINNMKLKIGKGLIFAEKTGDIVQVHDLSGLNMSKEHYMWTLNKARLTSHMGVALKDKDKYPGTLSSYVDTSGNTMYAMKFPHLDNATEPFTKEVSQYISFTSSLSDEDKSIVAVPLKDGGLGYSNKDARFIAVPTGKNSVNIIPLKLGDKKADFIGNFIVGSDTESMRTKKEIEEFIERTGYTYNLAPKGNIKLQLEAIEEVLDEKGDK